jgi:hypothetical protein
MAVTVEMGISQQLTRLSANGCSRPRLILLRQGRNNVPNAIDSENEWCFDKKSSYIQ